MGVVSFSWLLPERWNVRLIATGFNTIREHEYTMLFVDKCAML